ncbi:MAG: GspE/PulE family protein [Candidatus Gracilibacteria bacterium]
MSDQSFLTSQVQTNAGRAMADATGKSALSSINRDFEERAISDRARQMGMNYVDIAQIHINPDSLRLITSREAFENLVIPFFKIGKKLRVALAHPTSPGVIEVIRKLKEQGYGINVNLASESGIRAALEAYKSIDEAAQNEELAQAKAAGSYQEEIENIAALKDKLSTVTSEEALNFLSIGALKSGASDIHFQPEESAVTVRFRIDGVLQKVLELDSGTYGYLSNQLKYKCGMRINVANIPQDGRYFFEFGGAPSVAGASPANAARKIDVRVSSIPTEYGESFVCRLLDSTKRNMSFEELGFEGRNLEILKHSLDFSSGMILVTGPTGSGKTTTLYSMLKDFNQPDSKIITLEDPIEYHLSGVTQSQINEKRGYGFGSGLRAILRQDPDIVMIGEIRDLDTAETAAQAALTGHILLSTLHSNSAIETVPRLLNIGLKPYMIAPSLGVVIAQRLVRRVCPYCVIQKPVDESERKVLAEAIAGLSSSRAAAASSVPSSATPALTVPATLPSPQGCEKCNHTGYLGQITIAEMFENTDELKEAILAEKSTSELTKIVRAQGMLTTAEDGILKVLRGITTLSEVERVTYVPISESAPESPPENTSPQAPAEPVRQSPTQQEPQKPPQE